MSHRLWIKKHLACWTDMKLISYDSCACMGSLAHAVLLWIHAYIWNTHAHISEKPPLRANYNYIELILYLNILGFTYFSAHLWLCKTDDDTDDNDIETRPPSQWQWFFYIIHHMYSNSMRCLRLVILHDMQEDTAALSSPLARRGSPHL